MKILILGGSGFLGSHVVDRFIASSHDVSVYDLCSDRYRRTPAGVKYFAGDLGNVGALEEVISQGFDAVLHFISTTTPKSSNNSPEFDIQSNVVGSVNLLNICVKAKVKKFVFLSSGGTVYGDIGSEALVTEEHAAKPICSYGVTKLSIENYLHVYQHLHGIECVSLRISNPYGERQNPLLALGAATVFLYRALARQPIEIWGDGCVVRDFIYAGDVADAVYEGTTQPLTGIYNVGSGVGMSLNQLIDEIGEVVGFSPKVTRTRARPYDVPRIVLDSSKLQLATGWECTRTFKEGLMRTAQWLKQVRLQESPEQDVSKQLARVERFVRR